MNAPAPIVLKPEVTAFFHEATHTVTYIVHEDGGRNCAIIDSVLDYDAGSGRTATDAADEVIAHVRGNDLQVEWILETHAHADHLTAARYLKQHLGGRIAIGEHIATVQETFKRVFNLGEDFAADGSQFDHLLTDNEEFRLGALTGRVMHTPGHTPACVAYAIGDCVFCGDTIFMPDFGTARTDFPGGDAASLYRSIHKLLSLPEETRLFMCHDYGPNGRDYAWQSSVVAERTDNIHVNDGISEAEFVAMRTARDADLVVPALILPAIQVNIRAGALPPPENNGTSYLKIPLNAL
jgi:glyoxylase-like metal-dependent hydrolase (beta-lactamase superfamily II)